MHGNFSLTLTLALPCGCDIKHTHIVNDIDDTAVLPNIINSANVLAYWFHDRYRNQKLTHECCLVTDRNPNGWCQPEGQDHVGQPTRT